MILEPLEERIAPAGMVSFTDVDGDVVTVKASKGTNEDLASGLTLADLGDGHSALVSIDLTNGVFEGTNLSVEVKHMRGGDGLVDVGNVIAQGNALGTVRIQGTLGAISAGHDDDSGVGLKSLSVDEMKLLDSDLYGISPGVTIHGRLEQMAVARDMIGVEMGVLGGLPGDGGPGGIGSLSVGGSFSAAMFVDSTIGSITVKGDMEAFYLGAGGGADEFGNTRTGIGSITIGGSLGSATTEFGARIETDGGLKNLSVGGDIYGLDLGVGGGVNDQGLMTGGIGTITVGGSFRQFDTSAVSNIHTTGGLGSLAVKGDVAGVAFDIGGNISEQHVVTGGIGSITVGGSFLTSFGSAVDIASQAQLGKMSVGGDIRGLRMNVVGMVDENGVAAGGIGSIAVKGSIIANDETDDINIQAYGGLQSLSVGGSVVCVDNFNSLIVTGRLGTVQIAHDFALSPSVFARIDADSLGSLTVGGAWGGVLAVYDFTKTSESISIGGNLTGRLLPEDTKTISIGGGVSLAEVFDAGSTSIESGAVGRLTVGGSIAGTAESGVAFVIEGALGSLDIKGNVQDFGVNVGGVDVDGDVKSISVGGSAVGFSAVAGGDLGSLTIGKSASGLLVAAGGSADETGVHGGIGSISIRGNLGTEDSSAGIFTTGNLLSLSVGGDVHNLTVTASFLHEQRAAVVVGSIAVGGSVDGMSLVTDGSLGSLNVKKDAQSLGLVVGGMVDENGVETGGIGQLAIGGTLGIMDDRSEIDTQGGLGSLTVGGSMLAGIFDIAGSLGKVTVGQMVQNQVEIQVGQNVGSVTVGGAMRGGLDAGGDIKSVTVGGDLTGEVEAQGKTGALKIGGSMSGDILGGSIGSVSVGKDVTGWMIIEGEVNSISVRGSVVGDTLDYTGSINVRGNLDNLAIGGSIIGGVGFGTGTVQVGGDTASLRVGGDVRGSDRIWSSEAIFSGAILVSGKLAKVQIDGVLQTGTAGPTDEEFPVVVDGTNGTLRAGTLGSVSIGAVMGNAQKTALISALTSIGSVTVNGDWRSGNIVAGIDLGSDGFYGTADGGSDALHSIKNIAIKGALLASDPTDVTYGFAAQEIGGLTIGKTKYALHPGPGNDLIVFGGGTDTELRELPGLPG